MKNQISMVVPYQGCPVSETKVANKISDSGVLVSGSTESYSLDASLRVETRKTAVIWINVLSLFANSKILISVSITLILNKMKFQMYLSPQSKVLLH